MAADFKSSFIPKEPMTQAVFKKKKTGLVGVVAVTLFIFAIILGGGLYAYKKILNNDISSLQGQLAEAEKNIDKNTISNMARFAEKMDVVKSIIVKHQVISNILSSLSSSTVSAIYFTSFGYSNAAPNVLTVNLRGRSTSYAGVALQEDTFLKNKFFKSVKFSNLTLEDKGTVAFNTTITVDPELSIYSDYASNAPALQNNFNLPVSTSTRASTSTSAASTNRTP